MVRLAARALLTSLSRQPARTIWVGADMQGFRDAPSLPRKSCRRFQDATRALISTLRQATELMIRIHEAMKAFISATSPLLDLTSLARAASLAHPAVSKD
jgi:hypothetical protein